MKTTARIALLAVGPILGTACSPPDPGRPDLEAQAFLAVVAAQDARPAEGPQLDVLLAAVRSPRSGIRRAGVAGLGRLEDPGLVGAILPLLDDGEESVRMEAANALAQAVHRRDGGAALRPLLHRLEEEESPAVRGTLARSLGRLSLPGEGRWQVAGALNRLARNADGGVLPGGELLGVALGMESFVRGLRGAPPAASLRAALREMTRLGRNDPDADGTWARIRTVALLGYAPGGLTAGEIEAYLEDPATAVRRVAASRLSTLAPDERGPALARALEDPSAQVRWEGARALGQDPSAEGSCPRLLELAEGDPDAGVRLMALDGLAAPCPGGATLLERVAAGIPAGGDAAWHAPAHALVSLAALEPVRARSLLPAFTSHPNPFARAWAARAAAGAAAPTVLQALTRDPDANVRAAALEGLAAVLGRGADSTLVSAVAGDDAPQVLLAAAAGLEGTALGPQAREAALGTVERLGRTGAETLRDPRVALLRLARGLGSAADAPAFEGFLRDFDAAVAEEAAAALRAWTGRPYQAEPRATQPLSLPTPAELRAMEASEVILHMERGGSVRIRLLPREAPTNALRLFDLATSGALDGLTLHRVVPNFVLQGGSPGANEYAGHGAYTRDEVGLIPNWRGTVGLSTRGRDTGDGQIYVNLVDNVRLDHDYTILGEVVVGMDVADAVLEGDVIRRAEVRAGG